MWSSYSFWWQIHHHVYFHCLCGGFYRHSIHPVLLFILSRLLPSLPEIKRKPSLCSADLESAKAEWITIVLWQLSISNNTDIYLDVIIINCCFDIGKWGMQFPFVFSRGRMRASSKYIHNVSCWEEKLREVWWKSRSASMSHAACSQMKRNRTVWTGVFTMKFLYGVTFVSLYTPAQPSLAADSF